jgi:hypothetical protein
MTWIGTLEAHMTRFCLACVLPGEAEVVVVVLHLPYLYAKLLN